VLRPKNGKPYGKKIFGQALQTFAKVLTLGIAPGSLALRLLNRTFAAGRFPASLYIVP
jgi:hypothetical protein